MNALKTAQTTAQLFALFVVVGWSARADEKVGDRKDQPLARSASTEPKQHETLTVFTPDRKFFVSLIPAGTLKYCRADGTVLRTFYQCSPAAAVFSKDGPLLCSAGQYNRGVGAIKVWRLTDGRLLGKFNSETDEVPKLSFSPDARLTSR